MRLFRRVAVRVVVGGVVVRVAVRVVASALRRAPGRVALTAGRLAPALLLAASFATAGCSAISVPFLLLKSHEVKAEHQLVPGSVVVLAEPARSLPADDPRQRAFADQLAATASGHLTQNLPEQKWARDGTLKEGQTVVAFSKVIAARDADPEAFSKLPLDAMARNLGADRLVFVEITQVQLPDATATALTGALFTPAATGTVRVVDALGNRVFPPREGPETGGFLGSNGGRSFTVELRPRRVGDDDTDPAELRRNLANAAGLEVARLFYNWTGQRPGDQVYEERRRIDGQQRPGDRL